MSFKENLQYLRGSRNMTQEQLAMLLGVSRQAISKWESEKAYPEMDKLLMLCDMFGVTLDDLVMGDVRASAGCGGAGRVDLAADTDGVAGVGWGGRRCCWRGSGGNRVCCIAGRRNVRFW